jgi:hypothetical protein
MGTSRTVQPRRAQMKRYVPMVRQALIDFATQTWGPAPTWMWSERPASTTDEANCLTYAWVGAISTTNPPMRRAWLTADARVCICLERAAGSGDQFRVLTFHEYGYDRQDAVDGGFLAAYLTRTEVSLTTERTDEAVRSGIARLYDTLTQRPVRLILEGYDRPEVDIHTELAPGIDIWTRVLAKHT